MKKLLLAALVSLMGTNAWADNIMSANDVLIKAGEQADLVISLENDGNVAGFDFLLILPKGISLVPKGNSYTYSFSNRIPKVMEYIEALDMEVPVPAFNIDIVKRDDGTGFVITCHSGASGEILTGNNGVVLTLKLVASDSFDGDYEGKLATPSFSDPNGTAVNDIPDAVFLITTDPNKVDVGINDIKAPIANEKIYNLSGQQVNSPKRGVFIKAGKKVVK